MEAASMDSPVKKPKFEVPEGPPPKNAKEFFRYRIETMMQNVEKEMVIPERVTDNGPPPPKDFFRNVMGSSAGAGSGEFHVFRATRRREFARDLYLEKKAAETALDTEFAKKMEDARQALEEQTTKRRMKRQRKKHRKTQKQRAEDGAGTSTGAGSTDQQPPESDHGTDGGLPHSQDSDGTSPDQ